jgi:hypothetical protein
MSKDLFEDEYKDLDVYDILFQDEKYLYLFITSLSWLCKTENIKFNQYSKEVYINDSKSPLNKTNFDEFSSIVLTMNYKQKYKKEVIKEPVFKTEEGRKSWLKLQEMRKKYGKKEDDGLEIHNIINMVQLGGNFYISEEEIKKWSMYKLLNTYISIINKDNGGKMFDVYLQTGDKEMVKKDITQLLKVI